MEASQHVYAAWNSGEARSLAMTGVDIHACREGELARVYTVHDRLPISVQVGAMPESGSALDRSGVRMQHLSARRMRNHQAG